jgi:uroporphyrin-III C-methyltransferase
MTESPVQIVGAGPGDPDLLTIRALRAIQYADVILYDRLVSAEILALANPDAEFVYAGKVEGQQEQVQQEIFRQLVTLASSGRRVVRLKGGDPFVFGRGAEEAKYLVENGFAVEVVPGVSSAVGVPAAAGIPVTYRGLSSSFTVVTGHLRRNDPVDWSRFARVETLIVLMGVAHRQEIAQALIEAGRPADEPAAFIENGSTERQHVTECTLRSIAAGQVDVEAPAVFVVGEVVRLRASLLWAVAAAKEAR